MVGTESRLTNKVIMQTQTPAIEPFTPQPVASSPQLKASWVEVGELRSRMDAWDFLANNALSRIVPFESNVLLPALKHLATESVRVLVVEDVAAESHCNLVGLVPIEPKSIYRLPFKAAEIWKHDQCFDATPLLHKQFAVEAWKLICEKIKATGFSLLSLDTVSAEPKFERVFRAVEKQNRIVRFQRDQYQRVAFIPSKTATDFVQKHCSKNVRKSTKRQLRRLEELGKVTWEQSDSSSDFEQLTDEFLKLEASGWKGKEGTALASTPATKAFYEEMIRESAKAGKAKFLSLKLDGCPIAMLSDLHSEDFSYCYKTAYNEEFSSFSPGLQAEFKNIEYLHRDGIELGDSCTSTSTSSVNRIWGDKLAFQNLVLSLSPGLARTAVRALPVIQSTVHRLRNSSDTCSTNISQEKPMPKNNTQEKTAKISDATTCTASEKVTSHKQLENSLDNIVEMVDVELSDAKPNDTISVNREVIQTLEEFRTVQKTWDKFANDPLNSFSWNMSWWNAFQSEGDLHLIKFERAGQTIGLAPFYVDQWFGLNRFRLLATGDTCTDYVDLVCDPTHYECCVKSLAEYIRSKKFSVVELECTKDERLTISLKQHLDGNYNCDYRHVEPAWRLQLKDTWDEFKKQTKQSLRRKINKALRKINSDEFEISSSTEMSIEDAFETFSDLHTRRFESMGKPGVFADPKFKEFLKSAVVDFDRDGKCEIVFASHQGKTIASQLYFISENGFQLYQSGYDPDAMKLEPGHLLFTWMAKKAIDRGDSYLDFLRGNEPYKEYWGAVPHEQKKLRMVIKKPLPTVVAKITEVGRKLIRKS